jgi:hypothetical protein
VYASRCFLFFAFFSLFKRRDGYTLFFFVFWFYFYLSLALDLARYMGGLGVFYDMLLTVKKWSRIDVRSLHICITLLLLLLDLVSVSLLVLC